MTKTEIVKTWKVNYLPYVKIQEKGVADVDKRNESFNNWLDTLVECGNITDSERNLYKRKV